MTFKPAIVVVGYNRPNSLRRLLTSLTLADYTVDDVPLVISVDFSDSPEGRAAREYAEGFEWPFGTKRVICHPENLGLRKHILSCGDLASEFGSVIVFEDDLSVSPCFYDYAIAALEFTEMDPSIGGVSLYHYRTHFICRLPFIPLYDGFENYYLQNASSVGQAWSASQWQSFRKWYDNLADENPSSMDAIPKNAPIHPYVISWPNSSWLKYYIWYLVESDKYFLFPRVSYSTNHHDTGTHAVRSTPVWQVPLVLANNDFQFSTLEQSLAVYDSFFEICPNKLKKIAPLLENYDFDVDLFGIKPESLLSRPMVLTSRQTNSAPEMTFDLERKPLEANFQTTSREKDALCFSLANRGSTNSNSNLNLKKYRNMEYFHGGIGLREFVRNLLGYCWQKRK